MFSRRNLAFYSVSSGECVGQLADIHTEAVTSLVFDSSSAFIITSGDKHVRVFHNVPGKTMQIQVRDEEVSITGFKSILSDL